MGRKKKFIDKKKSATFQLFARDSSDPNYDESPGSDRVFVRVDNNQYSINTFVSDETHDNASNYADDDPNSIFADAPEDDDSDDVEGDFGKPIGSNSASAPLPEHVRREIIELGFPDDGYNYLTHLREIKNTGGGSAFYHNSKARLDQLPLDVKAYDASRVQISEVNDNPNEKSIYSVASKSVGVRIQKAVDPDVAALLDDDNLSRFGSDVEDLEEDFIVQANIPEEGEGSITHKKLNVVEGSEEIQKELNKSNTCGSQENVVEIVGVDEVRNHRLETGDDFVDEKPRVRRPLDEQFDLLELQEYGSGSDEEHDGSIAEEDESLADKLNHALKDHGIDELELDDKYKAPGDLLHDNERPKNSEILDSAADVIHWCVEYAEKYVNEEQDENVVLDESSDESEVWDCETIISTYSNLDNHPGKIEVPGITRKKKLADTVSGAFSAPSPLISLRGKEKLPVDFLPHNRKAATEKVKDVGSARTEQQKRKQHGQETKEEKKERKAALKEERREARRVKKEMKELYKCEGQRAQKVAAISGPSSIHLM